MVKWIHFTTNSAHDKTNRLKRKIFIFLTSSKQPFGKLFVTNNRNKETSQETNFKISFNNFELNKTTEVKTLK